MALDLAQVRALGRIQALAFGLGYPVAKFRGGALLVNEHAELGHGLGTRLVASLRHHGGLIPAADGAEVAETVQLLLMLFELLI
ncbi:hypothetical protein D3C85_1513800 [compost metagenome]